MSDLFKHALIQDAAYESLLKSTRQQYHQRIAQALETQFPETVETQPELVAQHYTEAGLAEQAVHYWQRAGQRAAERSAHAEAVSHLTKGLEVLGTLPDPHTRAHDELQFHCVLGTSLIATRGFAAAAVEQTYTRARELCQQLPDTPHLFQVLVGLWGLYDVRDHLLKARAMGEQLLALAHHQQDSALLAPAHRMLGETCLWLGELGQARAHLEQGLALYDPQQHRAQGLRDGHDAGTSGLGFLSRVLWNLGYPDQALQRSREALALAQDLGHPFSLAFTLRQTVSLHQLRRETDEVLARTQRLLTLATEHGFAQLLATGRRDRGWALTMRGHVAEGIALLHQGQAAFQATGGARAYPCVWLAEALGKAGEADAGLQVLAEGLALVAQHEERVYEAELHRLTGELLLAQSSDQHAAAHASFQQALTVARRQQAKSLELRAAMSLARLWQQQGKRAEAHELLAPVYDWFTEGFDTADLQEAKALLTDGVSLLQTKNMYRTLQTNRAHF